MSTTDIAHLLDEPDVPRTFKRFRIQFTEGAASVGSKITAVVTDISMNGLCFHTPVFFEEGSEPVIDITIGIQTFSVPCLVRRCKELERPGRFVYACGVQFVKSAASAAFVPTLAKYLVSRGFLKAA
jgi:hypothetical protein